MENYYELLEISQNASDEVISKVFKHHIKKNHPDLYRGQEKKEAEIRVKKLNEAYEILSNPDKRKEYDNELKNYENEKNNIKELEIDQLKNRNEKLNQTIQNYNRFIYELSLYPINPTIFSFTFATYIFIFLLRFSLIVS